MQPHIFCRSDQRSSTTRSSDQQGQPHFDRTCNAEVVTAVRRKVQTEIFCHRRPVEEMRLIQRADFTAHKLRMLRELPQQPRFIGSRPRHERRLQCVHDARPNQPLGDFIVAIAPTLWIERIEPTRGHDHHLAVVMFLHQIHQRAIAICNEF